MSVRLIEGDCVEAMKTFPDNHFSSIVCDPPYMIDFMGKAFDTSKNNIAGRVEVWAEALRVAKPGAHLLAFGGDRTHHRMMCAIEDAGWELRTCLYWCFGSGFPKSHSVEKAIDRMRNDDIRHVCRYLRSAMERQGKNSKYIAEVFGFHARMVDHWAARDTDSQPSVPTWEQWQQLKSLLALGDEMDAEVWRLNGRKGKPGDAWHEREAMGQSTNGIAGGTHQHAGIDGAWGFNSDFDITAPATDAAKQWIGWGSALKPAIEIIIMARKPLAEPTIAANVLRWNCGGLNIDGCRIEGDKPLRVHNGNGSGGMYEGRDSGYAQGTTSQGRWPANLLLSDDAAALLDQMSGERKSGGGNKSRRGNTAHTAVYGTYNAPPPDIREVDVGHASRFFLRVAHDDEPLRIAYHPKASKRDRDEGLEGMPERYKLRDDLTPEQREYVTAELQRLGVV